MAANISPNAARVTRIVIMLIALAIVLIYRNFHDSKPDNIPAPDAPAKTSTNSDPTTGKKTPTAGAGDYLFCFWNVENLFDDRNDKRVRADEEYDNWFAENAEDRQKKYDHLATALVKLNGGIGPDILCVAEVETMRAAELLEQALNAKLPKDAVPYGEPVMKEVSAGRHIAPALLTRIKVERDRTKGYGTSRILETHLTANGKDLIVFASHWTSQLTDKTGDHREKYADQIYGQVTAMYKNNPKVDVLVCGDFNDVPESPAVQNHLHAIDNPARLNFTDDFPTLLDLMADKDPNHFGTIFYHKPLIYDHIIVSPGLLDHEGWSCDPASIHTETDGLTRPGATRREPWRFGNPKDDHARGYSDHFPVTVKLHVQ